MIGSVDVDELEVLELKEGESMAAKVPGELVDEIKRRTGCSPPLAKRFAALAIALWSASAGSTMLEISGRRLARLVGVTRGALWKGWLKPARRVVPAPFEFMGSHGGFGKGGTIFLLADWVARLLPELSTLHPDSSDATGMQREPAHSVARDASIRTSSIRTYSSRNKEMDGSPAIIPMNPDSSGMQRAPMHPSTTELAIAVADELCRRLASGPTERPAPTAGALSTSAKHAEIGETATTAAPSTAAASRPGRSEKAHQLEDAHFALPPELAEYSVFSHLLQCHVPAAALAAPVVWTRELWCAVLEECRQLLFKAPEKTFNSRWFELAVNGLLEDPARGRELVADARRRIKLDAKRKAAAERAAEHAKRDADATARAAAAEAARREEERLRREARADAWEGLTPDARGELDYRAREIAAGRSPLPPGANVHDPRWRIPGGKFDAEIKFAIGQMLDAIVAKKFEPAARAERSPASELAADAIGPRVQGGARPPALEGDPK